MKSLFKRRTEIDWGVIKTSYGNASKIPLFLDSLLSSLHAERENAHISLENLVVLQSDLYEAAYFVIEPLVDILENPTCMDKSKLFDLLYEIANGYAPDYVTLVIDGGRRTLMEACKSKLKDYTDRIKSIQTNTDKEFEIKKELIESLNNVSK